MTEIKTGALSLAFIWNIRLKLYAEAAELWAGGDRLHAEADRLHAEAAKLWAEGDKLRAGGDRLWAEAAKLRAEGDKLWAGGDRLWAEADKLRAEADKLRAEGAKLWAEAILEAHGNIKVKWTYVDAKSDSRCELETGEVFEP